MKRRDRDVEVFSLSFLDCICCGFGAIILLLVLTEVGEPLVLEQSRLQLEGTVQELTEQLEQIRGETEILNRDLKGVAEQRDREKLRLARLSGDLSSIQGKYSSSKSDASVTNILEKPPVLLTELAPDRAKSLARIVDRLLAKRAADRFQSAAELREALAQPPGKTSGPGIAGRVRRLFGGEHT